MTSIELARDYKARAALERLAGGSIEIDRGLPSVAIVMSDGTEYYYQEWQADNLLDKAAVVIRNCGMEGMLSFEDYLLATFQNA